MLATLTNTANGDDVHDRIVVIDGQSVADGAYSPQSVAMRINDSGPRFARAAGAGLAAGQLDLATLLPPGTVLIDECFISVIGCWGSAQVTIANPPPSFSKLHARASTRKPNSVFGDIRIHNLRVDVDINGSGLVPNCGLRLTATQLSLTGNYALEPAGESASDIDVNLIRADRRRVHRASTTRSPPASATRRSSATSSRPCCPTSSRSTTDGIRGFLSDPDGAGPQDSPIAAAIQTTLAGISISGPIGSGPRA